jgi:RNA polymerase sigma factor (sigma-70 family)
MGLKNNADAFIRAFEMHYHTVFNAVYQRVNNIEDAEDICQDIFTILLKKFDEVTDVRRWLFGTLKNSVYKYYRDRKPGVNIDEIFQDISLTFVNGFRDARLTIEKAIEEAVDDGLDRSIFEMIACGEYSYASVSRITGLTVRKVEYRYSMIVKKIIENLKSNGIREIGDLL